MGILRQTGSNGNHSFTILIMIFPFRGLSYHSKLIFLITVWIRSRVAGAEVYGNEDPPLSIRTSSYSVTSLDAISLRATYLVEREREGGATRLVSCCVLGFSTLVR
jgi:hypothetical protein